MHRAYQPVCVENRHRGGKGSRTSSAYACPSHTSGALCRCNIATYIRHANIVHDATNQNRRSSACSCSKQRSATCTSQRIHLSAQTTPSRLYPGRTAAVRRIQPIRMDAGLVHAVPDRRLLSHARWPIAAAAAGDELRAGPKRGCGPKRMAGHLALEPICAADLSGFTTRAGVVIGDAKAEPFAIELAWVSDPPLRDLSQKLWNLGTRHAACCVCCTPLGTCMAEPLNAPAATRCAAAQSDGGRPAATYIETKCLRPRPDVQ
jgi:hypothetical protein